MFGITRSVAHNSVFVFLFLNILQYVVAVVNSILQKYKPKRKLSNLCHVERSQ